MSTILAEKLRTVFGVENTSATSISIGSPDDLLDAFRRYTSSTPERYTLQEFKEFVSAVREHAEHVPGLNYYGQLLQTYVERVPDMGWERCARQVWPLLNDVRTWVEDQEIPINKIGVRPVFEAIPGHPAGAYQMVAFLCNHNNGCDCGLH